MANRNRKKIFQFISKLRNVACNNVILFLHILICQILKNRYIVHRCQGTKSGIFIHHWREMSLDLSGSKFKNMSSTSALKKKCLIWNSNFRNLPYGNTQFAQTYLLLIILKILKQMSNQRELVKWITAINIVVGRIMLPLPTKCPSPIPRSLWICYLT